MLILSESVTREVVDLDAIIGIIEEEARAQAQGRVIYPDPPTQVLLIDQPKCRYRIKSCALPDIPVVGIRIIGYPLGLSDHDSTRFVMLSDPKTGTPLALVDDHWTYTLRTAASAVVGLRYLIPQRPLWVAMIGAGNLASAVVMLLAHLRLLKGAVVTSRRPESRQAFSEKWAQELGVPMRAVSNAAEAMQDADLVVTSTNAGSRLIEKDYVKAGMTLCTLGQFELAPDIYRTADKLVVDRWNVAKASPDVKELIKNGAVSQESVYAELHELVSGAKPGRERDSETIIFRTDGLVTQDVAIAYAVYQTARASGLGITL